MSNEIKGVHVGSGDAIAIEFVTTITEGALFISNVDLNTVKTKVADFLVETFKWLPSSEEIAELISVREATIAKLMKENIRVGDRNVYLEKKLEILLKIEALINVPEFEASEAPDRRSTGVDEYNG